MSLFFNELKKSTKRLTTFTYNSIIKVKFQLLELDWV